jgi:trimeric autotransporter adhesin
VSTGTITALPVALTAVPDTRVYNGTLSSTGIPTLVPALVSGDTGTFTQAFDTKNVGTLKTLTPAGVISDGNAGHNYALTFVPASGAITALGVTSNVAASSKPYDGTNAATVTNCTLATVLPPDATKVTCTAAAATFENSNAAAGKLVTATGITLGAGTGGDESGNYTLNGVSTATTHADILALGVTATITAADRTYDGTLIEGNANMTCTVVGVLSGDAGNVACTAINGSFNTSQVLTANLVTATVVPLSGSASGNYTLATQTTASVGAHITRKPVAASITAADKIYDGASAEPTTGMTCSVSVVLPGDAANVACTATNGSFNTSQVLTANVVTATVVPLSGSASANYTLGAQTTTTAPAHITNKTLTATGITANSKPYDGNANATLNFGGATLPGVVSGDSVSLNIGAAIGTFSNPMVGAGKLVTVTGLTIGGTSASNYVLTVPYTTTASITAWSLNGFYQPVTMSGSGPAIFNSIKGGQTVPLKFNIFQSAGGAQLTDVATAIQSMLLAPVGCSDGALIANVDPASLTNTGGTALRYDGTQFIENWQTPKGANQCFVVTMTAADGSPLFAYFKTK